MLPKKLVKLGKKKVVYVFAGSLSSAYKPLMERIVEVLSQLPEYAFILGAGPHIEYLEIGENTYAERFVNQLAVLQSGDCFVTHRVEWKSLAKTAPIPASTRSARISYCK